jgi:phosphoglucosamine mutase
MGRKYFGTDGVRGHVGEHPMTVEFALRLASAAARVLAPDGGTALIGKDTRLSGYMFEAALEAGCVAAGVSVQLIGPLPTPGIAYLTQKFGCKFGVVISASHNMYEDNGIKFFDEHGSKLSDELESQIEAYLDEPALTRESNLHGKAARVDKSRVVNVPGFLCVSAARRHGLVRAEDRRSIARTAPATRSRRACLPTWAPRSSRSAARRTAATST